VRQATGKAGTSAIAALIYQSTPSNASAHPRRYTSTSSSEKLSATCKKALQENGTYAIKDRQLGPRFAGPFAVYRGDVLVIVWWR
jgi:hypothetical protein